MQSAIEFAVGITYLLVGLSLILHPQDWRSWLGAMRMQGRMASIAMGAMGLGISSMIVGFHPIFTGLPVIVTLIGIIGIFKSALYLLFPGSLSIALSFFAPMSIASYRILGMLAASLGAFIMVLIFPGWFA